MLVGPRSRKVDGAKVLVAAFNAPVPRTSGTQLIVIVLTSLDTVPTEEVLTNCPEPTSDTSVMMRLMVKGLKKAPPTLSFTVHY